MANGGVYPMDQMQHLPGEFDIAYIFAYGVCYDPHLGLGLGPVLINSTGYTLL